MNEEPLRDNLGQYIRGQKKYSNEKLLSELRRSYEKVDGSLTQTEHNRVSDIPHNTFCARFGSWNDAKRVAGLGSDEYSADVTRRERQERIKDIKETQPCASCGDNRCAVAMDFHHTSPESKEDAIANMCNAPLQHTWDDVLVEIEKCVLVCKACHAEIEWGERPCP